MNFQPVPIHSTKQGKDFILRPDEACSNFDKMMKAQEEKNEMKNWTDYYKPYMDQINVELALEETPITTMRDMWWLYDFMMAQEADQLDFPIKLDSKLGKTIADAAKLELLFI